MLDSICGLALLFLSVKAHFEYLTEAINNIMNKSGRAIVKDSRETTDDKVLAPILPKVLQILSKSEKSLYRYLEGASQAFGDKSRGKSGMAIRLERDIITKFAIPTLLFFGYPSSSIGIV